MGRSLHFTTILFLVSLQLIHFCDSVEWDKRSSPLQNLQSFITRLSEEVHRFLVSTFGENTVDMSLEILQNSVKWLSEVVASVLNEIIRDVTETLESEEIDAKLPLLKVTPEEVIFVTKWALLAALAYWIISFILRLVVETVWQMLWLLEGSFAMWMFVSILSDTEASSENTEIRLAGLACVCVLLAIVTLYATPDTHLESQVVMLGMNEKGIQKEIQQTVHVTAYVQSQSQSQSMSYSESSVYIYR